MILALYRYNIFKVYLLFVNTICLEVTTLKRPTYDGIKFYSVYDWNIEEHLEKAAHILESFVEHEEYIETWSVVVVFSLFCFVLKNKLF